MRPLLPILFLAFATALLLGSEASHAGGSATSHGGVVDVRLDRERLREWGLSALAEQHRVRVDASSGFEFDTVGDSPIAIRAGSLHLIDMPRLSAESFASPRRLRAVPVYRSFEFELIDSKGRVWFVANLGHPHPFADGHAEVRHLDLRMGPALASALGTDLAYNEYIGELRLDLPVTVQKKGEVAKSCANIQFPPTNNVQIDVQLTTMSGGNVGITCNGLCDGNGGNSGARLKFHPGATLKNVGTADVPWYSKFTHSPYSYPYVNNDSHPMLVWSMYRINAAGQIEQLARSFTKHAFFATNTGCGCSGDNILYTNCSDDYSASTNDSLSSLAPREEIIPHTGQWGRCGSLRDRNCNGVDDQNDDNSGNPDGNNISALGSFGLRPQIRETDVAASLNAGATYYVEPWYVVRDDIQINNSLGSRAVAPTWSGSAWTLPFAPGSTFANGPVIDRWVPANSTSATSMSRDIDTGHGLMRLAVKVANLGGGQYRYDYALMNFSFTNPVTSGSEPNLVLHSNHGAVGFEFPASTDLTAGASTHDGDLDAGNNWAPSFNAGTMRFSAGKGQSQIWGALFRFSVVANQAPVATCAQVELSAAPGTRFKSVDTLAPTASAACFSDGFESN